MALSPQRWFWAVITVYLVFLGARSRGDTIYRGLQRVGGTILGIASGLVLATFAAGHPGLETALLLLSVFGMFYYITVSYTVGIFCVTVLLGLLYGMMGAPVETLLVLRLEETAIGAAAGILVATFVYPVRTRDQVMRSGRAVLAMPPGGGRCLGCGADGGDAPRGPTGRGSAPGAGAAHRRAIAVAAQRAGTSGTRPAGVRALDAGAGGGQPRAVPRSG
jgi:hypothetical protein